MPWIGLWSVIVAIKYLCSLAKNRLLFKDNNSVFLNLQTITQSFMYLQTTDRKSSVIIVNDFFASSGVILIFYMSDFFKCII